MDEDNNQSPPPLPNRPGRPVRIQSIDALKPENRSNDYVDTNTIAATINPPKRPPKVHTLKKPKQAVEQQDNANNEHREQLKACQNKTQEEYKSAELPQLPPRNNRAPALPPRAVTNFPNIHGLSRPTNIPSTPPSLVEKSFQQCNPTSERHQVNPVRTNTSNRNSNRLQSSVLIITSEPPRLSSSRFPSLRRQDKSPSKDSPLVTQQPQTANNITLTLDQTGALNNTIICPQCGRCRCSHCTGDRQLPERWLCEGNCRCSADSVVDTLSCMCCVKSCFKTCIDNPDGQRVDPCSCTDTPKCLVRWSAMAALSLCLPCLCCYWPMQLGVKAATACYNSPCCRNRGCNCEDWEPNETILLTADLIRNLHCHVCILTGTPSVLRLVLLDCMLKQNTNWAKRWLTSTYCFQQRPNLHLHGQDMLLN